MATVDETMLSALNAVITVLSGDARQSEYDKQADKLDELAEHVIHLSHPVHSVDSSTKTIALPTTRDEVVPTLREAIDMVLGVTNPTQKIELRLVLKRSAELLRTRGK
jgi:hypothetical protein